MEKRYLDMGSVGMHPKGVYDKSVTYSKLQLVTYRNNTYLSKQDGNVGHEPVGEDEWWSLIVDAQTAYDGATSATAAAKRANDAADNAERINAEVQKAEDLRITSEQERTTAETARDKAEQARQGDENLRKTAEENRASAETGRSDAEQRRTANENSRETAEQMRKTDEAERIRDEKEREEAETSRKAAERERTTAEQTRQENETTRVSAEAERVLAETSRQSAEVKREQAAKDNKAANDAAVAAAEAATAAAYTATGKANTAATNADMATANANAAANGASKVNAVMGDDHVLTVTDRTGTVKTADLGDVSDVARLKRSLGPYSERPDIVLTAKETDVAVSAEGVKVAKTGWAIAEFTAELGNEYLFKPGATDGNVCVFAEYIDKIERRAIEYTYTYDEKGRIATAKATYDGKTHSYTYAYDADAATGDSCVITDDQTGQTVDYLPATFQTTVGSYQPMTLLNADAELPEDGYCRFVSNFQSRRAIKVVVSYKVDSADLTMKVVRDGMTASMCTQLSKINQKVDETKATAEELRSRIEISGAAFAGFARVNGDPLPDAQTVYGNKELVHRIGKHLRMAAVKNGKTVYLAPGRITADENGKAVAIDGTEGDILCATDTEMYLMRATDNAGGVEQNVIGLGLGPCAWYGNAAKRIPKFGMVPGYTVNAKLADDTREQAHSVYNKSVIGSFGKPADFYIENLWADGGGLPNCDLSALDTIRQAQNKNEDPLTARPYMGLHPDFYSVWLAMMFTEMGTLNITSLTRMGTGNTEADVANASNFYDNQMSANSGVKIINTTGAVTFAQLSAKSMKLAAIGQTERNINALNSRTTPMTEMLEPQRVMDAVVRDGLMAKIGDPNTFFYFGEDGTLQTIESGSGFDVTTGEGMVSVRRYYQLRNVPDCEGLADGVMTGVVNCYLRMDCKDGVQLADDTSMDGGRVIYKFSHAVYRGMSIPHDGMFKNLCYAYYVAYGHGDKVPMDYIFATTYNIDDVKPLTVFNDNAYAGNVDVKLPVLEGLDLRLPKAKSSSGWLKSANYSVSMSYGVVTGGSSHSHEVAYLYRSEQWGGIGSDGYIAEGKKQVCSLLVGCRVYGQTASPRTFFCDVGFGYSNVSCGGSFAVLL